MEAIVSERGNGFPAVGDYVEGAGALWKVVATNGVVHTNRPLLGNYIYAEVEEADEGDCPEADVFAAGIEFDDNEYEDNEDEG